MDWRVRQAIALTLDRPKIVKQLLGGYGDPGNDSPFAPVYPSTGKTLPQRHLDLARAKKLLAQAGYPRGFKVTLTTEKFAEIPQLAQILVSSVKKIGIDMSLEPHHVGRLLRQGRIGRRDGPRHDAVAQHADQHHGLGGACDTERRS